MLKYVYLGLIILSSFLVPKFLYAGQVLPVPQIIQNQQEVAEFGYAIDIHKNFLVVGVPKYDANGIVDKGLVVVYRKAPSGAWYHHQTIDPTFPNNEDPANLQIGKSVSIVNDTIAFGAPTSNATDEGINRYFFIYRYDSDDEQWHEEFRYKGSFSVSIGNNVALSGISFENGMMLAMGSAIQNYNDSVLVYRRVNGQNWIAHQVVKPYSPYQDNNQAPIDFSVSAIDSSKGGDHFDFLIGSKDEAVNGNVAQGAAYRLTFDEDTYELGVSGRIVNPNGSAGDQYGYSVAFDRQNGNSQVTVYLIGAPYEDNQYGVNAGAVYGLGSNRHVAKNAGPNQYFGKKVAVDFHLGFSDFHAGWGNMGVVSDETSVHYIDLKPDPFDEENKSTPLTVIGALNHPKVLAMEFNHVLIADEDKVTFYDFSFLELREVASSPGGLGSSVSMVDTENSHLTELLALGASRQANDGYASGIFMVKAIDRQISDEADTEISLENWDMTSGGDFTGQAVNIQIETIDNFDAVYPDESEVVSNVLVGAPGRDENALMLNTGIVYSYQCHYSRNCENVYQCQLANKQCDLVQSVTDPAGYAYDRFGYDLDVDGDFMVVGKPSASLNGPKSGGAVVFTKGRNGWIKQFELKPQGSQMNASHCGYSVSISGSYIIVGCPLSKNIGANGANAGAAILYYRSGEEWFQQEILRPPASDAEDGDWFGYDVDIDERYIAVGAPRDNSAEKNVGAAYLYYRADDDVILPSGGEKITPYDAQSGMLFGSTVSLTHHKQSDGYYNIVNETSAYYNVIHEMLAVGAPSYSVGEYLWIGKVYTYQTVFQDYPFNLKHFNEYINYAEAESLAMLGAALDTKGSASNQKIVMGKPFYYLDLFNNQWAPTLQVGKVYLKNQEFRSADICFSVPLCY